MDFDQFLILLDNMKSSNNEERAEAEEIYSSHLESNGMMIVEYLIQTIQVNPKDQTLFLYCLIHLQIIFKRWSEILIQDQSNDENIQSFLLSLIDNPSELENIQFNTSNLIATAAELYLQNEHWLSFQSDLIQRCSSENILSTSISLDCLVLSIHKGLIDVQLVEPLLDEWYQMIWPSDPSYAHLIIIRLIFILAKANHKCECFSDFIENFPSFIFDQPPQFANTVLSDLTNYTDIILRFFDPNFGPLFECFMNIFTNDQQEKGERELCLEIVAEITKSNKKEMYQYAEDIFTALLLVSSEISGPDFINEDYEDPTPRTSAEKSIRRFSKYFISEEDFSQFIYSIFSEFNKMTDSPEKYRASFILMRETVEYLNDCFSFFNDGSICEELVNNIIEGIQFPNEICQFAALQVLTELSKYLSPSFQNNYNSILIEILIKYIQSNLETSQFALEALSYMISGSDKEYISSYLDDLYESLISIFDQLPTASQIFDLNCISSLIMKTGDQMDHYYQNIVSVLDNIIQMNELSLTLPAIKAFSSIGLFYISEEFVSDSKRFIDFILTMSREDFNEIENDAINSALKIFVSALGSNFPEEFSQLMDSLIKIVDQQIIPKQIPLASDRSDYIDEVLIPNEKENLLYIYSRTKLNEIYSAIETLKAFLIEMGELVVNCSEKLVEVFSKTISYYFDDNIQSTTIECLNELVGGLIENQVTDFNPLIVITDSFNEVILNNHQDFEVILSFLDFIIFLSKCIINLETVDTSFLESIFMLALKSIERCQNLNEEDEEWELLPPVYTNLGKILRFIIKCPQINDEISEKIHSLSEQEFSLSSELPPFIIPGVIIFWIPFSDTILNDLGAFNNVLQFILEQINIIDDDEEKETILMSLADIIESNLFKEDENLEQIISVLSEFLTNYLCFVEEKADSELKNSIDASVYVLSCLFLKYSELLNNQDLVSLWFKSLPLKGRKDPCFMKVYDLLLDLLSKNHSVITDNLTHLLKIISKAIKGTNSSDETKDNFKEFIQLISSDEQSKGDFEISFGELSKKDQTRILSLLETPEEES